MSDESNPNKLSPEEEAQIEAEIAAETAAPVGHVDAPTPQAAAAGVPATGVESRVKSLSPQQMAALRRQERLFGESRLKAKWEALVKQKGYNSVEEALEKAGAVPAVPTPSTAPTQEAPKPTNSRAETNKTIREYEDKLALAEKKALLSRQKAKDLQLELELKEIAWKAGSTDPDYAVQLLRRRMAKLTDQEFKTFNPETFFQELKKSHGYLFGKEQPVEEVPANTAPKGASAPKTEPTTAKEPEKETDARKMSKQEYDNWLAAKGIRNPAYIM